MPILSSIVAIRSATVSSVFEPGPDGSTNRSTSALPSLATGAVSARAGAAVPCGA